ncbi:uncharacterized protein si:ch211-157b11.14 [Syngnathus acus]|uniref:uncharacterized protein si:ch211-157b11.14 n=1 Tax=Syngnathus acus TaxID=161584 RepID=UPI001885B083|nr:uncharacterized protein si:ch211-157b11.14 [Syngnathus acus]
MDDLDHSMCIAKEEWSNFFKESEECCLPQPLLARPEGLRCPIPLDSAAQSLQSLDENNTACVQMELIHDVGTREDEEIQICDDIGSGYRKEVHMIKERSPEETKKSIVQIPEAVSDVARSLSIKRESNARCQAEDGNKAPQREEKERWFVTLSLNDTPGSRRACATPKNKRSKLRKDTRKSSRESQDDESEVNKNINQNGSKEMEEQKSSCHVVQNDYKETWQDVEKNQRQKPLYGEDIKQNHEGKIHDGNIIPGTLHDIAKNNREESDGDVTKNPREGTEGDGGEATHEGDTTLQVKIEGTPCGDEIEQNDQEGTDEDHRRKQDDIEGSPHGDNLVQDNSEGTLHEVGTTQHDGNLSSDHIMEDNKEGTIREFFHLDRVDSDEFEDSVDFFTLHSSDSEMYLSASESVPRELFEEDLIENRPRQCQPYSSSLSYNWDPIQSSGAGSLQDPDCNGSGTQAFVESLPSSNQQKTGPSRVQTEPHLPICDVDCPQLVPDVIITPVVDSPEAYAQAEDRTPCVYAISAFWDEMEKLTINDILQLRTGKSSPSTEMSDVPSLSSSLVDPEEHHLTDGGLTDVSDAADSDYFTQPDDSKADRSSWDFSVCDFEEDYWQFLGISGNPSPDPSCKTQQEENEVESGTRSQTPVPIGDSIRPNPTPRAMTKKKSVQNVCALKDSFSQSHLHQDEKKGNHLGSIVAAPVQGEDLESLCIYDSECISGCDMICTYEHKISLAQSHKWKPIPIFSCSHPTVRELTLPDWNYPFLSVDLSEDDVISPVRIVSHALRVAETQSGRIVLSFGKIRFRDKGSVWCRSDGWEVLGQSEEHSIVPVVGGVSPPLPEQQRIVGAIQRPVRQGVLSTLQQSDMCLVCIAFASWVLTSSDTQSADAWKAALLANVSALSAIQYLRQIK